MKNVKLLPCPFCGSTEDLRVVNDGSLLGFDQTWFVYCPECGARGPEFSIRKGDCQQTEKENTRQAKKAWNRRATP